MLNGFCDADLGWCQSHRLSRRIWQFLAEVGGSAYLVEIRKPKLREIKA